MERFSFFCPSVLVGSSRSVLHTLIFLLACSAFFFFFLGLSIFSLHYTRYSFSRLAAPLASLLYFFWVITMIYLVAFTYKLLFFPSPWLSYTGPFSHTLIFSLTLGLVCLSYVLWAFVYMVCVGVC